MQRSRLPLTLAMVTFALSLLSGGYLYQKVVRTVPALIMVHDLPTGAEITADMVRVVRVPAGGRPDRALYGPGQIAGMHAAVPLFGNQILTARHVTAAALERDPLAQLGPGQRIVSVPVRAEAALGGALRPGDLVDVVAAWPGPEGKPGAVEVLATGVQVLDLRNAAGISTSRSTESFGPDNAVPAAVLLLVSTQQGRVVVGAVESRAAIYLWLSGRDAK